MVDHRDEEEARRADTALVRSILAGDREAVPALSSRLSCVARVLSARNARCGGILDEHELSDLGQDVFLILWRKLGSYSGKTVLPAWACRIAVLEYQNALRRKLRRPAEQHLAPDDWEEPARGRPPSDRFEYEDVHLALQRVGRDEARVVRLKHFGGCTFAEICQLLGVAESTVKDRYYRGLVALRALLDPRREGGAA
jgi:RNA polymerase sigma-70 factor (ECF subfamily)